MKLKNKAAGLLLVLALAVPAQAVDVGTAVRVWETTTDTSSPYDLAGVSTNQQGLQTFVGAGLATLEVFIMEAHKTANEWQWSRATVTDAATDTYVINQVIKSSNSDSQVSWSAGTRDVFVFDPHSYSDGALHTITGATTLDETYHLVLCNSSSAFQVDLPPVANYQGKTYIVKNINTGTVTLKEDSGDSSTVENLSGGFATSQLLTTNATWTAFRSDGTKWRRVGGNALSITAEVIAGTAGSVLFVDATGDLGQDNSNFYWDNSSKHLGIGTNSPGAALDVDGDAVFNESGADVDFRIEGDTEQNLLFVDASTDRVGIGTATPSALIHSDKTGADNVIGLRIDRSDTATRSIDFYASQNGAPAIVAGSALSIQGTGLTFKNSSGTNVLQIADTGAIVVNETDADADFRIEGDTEQNLVFVDASTDRVGIGTATPGYLLSLGTSLANTKLALYDDGASSTGLGVQSGAFRFHLYAAGGNRYEFYDAPAGNQIFHISGAGNVGIGAAAVAGPGALLEVSSDINETPDDTKAIVVSNIAAATVGSQSYSPSIIWEGQGWKTDATAASQSVEFRAYVQPVQAAAAPTGNWLLESSIDGGAYSSLMAVTSAGFVGISTTAPQSLLDVQGPTGTGAASAGILTLATKELTIVDGDQLGRINFNSPLESDGTDAILAGAAIWAEADATFDATTNNTELVFGTATSSAAVERVRIDATGFVGINTSTPTHLLHIVTKFTNGIEGILLEAVSGSNDHPLMNFANNAGTVKTRIGVVGAAGGFGPGTTPGDTILRAENAAIHLSADGAVTNALTVTSGNLVGISTTVPQSLLDVQGPTGTGAAAAGILTLATKELTIVDGDQLGRINFNSPLESDGTDAILAGAAIWAEADATFSSTVNNTELVFGTATSSAAVERMRIDADGNVGIGTSTPAQALHMGDDKLIARDVNAGLTASVTQTQGQGALTAEINEVATVANTNDTVTMPTATAGLMITVINNGANTLQIFPASGDNLGAGVDTAVTLASGSNVRYVSYDATNWETAP